jgi:WD40 repeat protein
VSRIVCQVLHRPNRVTFVWSAQAASSPAASFEPYHLEDHEADSFYQAARAARQTLAGVAHGGAPPQGAIGLACAGHRLFQAIFRHNADDPEAREIQNWLQNLRDRNEIASLEMLGDLPGRVPWNIVYDQEPREDILRSGDPAGLWPFWGRQYCLAAGKRVNPLRVASVLEDPSILLVADPDLLERLPAAQKNLLSDWASAHELTILNSVTALHQRLRDVAPDVLYLFGSVERGALGLGDESVTPAQLRDFLAAAKAGNPDPVVFLQACGEDGADDWERFVNTSANTLTGVVMCDVPVSPELANALGVDALSRFIKKTRLGQDLREVRSDHELAALAYSAFCPSHVRVADEADADPDVAGPEPLPLPDYPYRPLLPYESEDRPLFTGREDDTVRCASLLDEAAAPGLILHGPAGVGKSSFLRAGLVPHLETEAVGYLALRDRTVADELDSAEPQGENDYPTVALRPGTDFMGQLAEALCAFCAQSFRYTTPLGEETHIDLPGILKALLDGVPVTTASSTAITARRPAEAPLSADVEQDVVEQELNGVPAATLARALVDDPTLLTSLLDELTRRLPYELVLVVEQAEDWVLYADRAAARRRQQALAALSGVLNSAARCKIILSIRTEFYGRLLEHFPAGQERCRNFYLDPLGKEQLLRAVLWPTAAEPLPYSDEVPREKYQFAYEQDLASQIVTDVVEAARQMQRSAVPLLQIIAADLYDRAQKRRAETLTRADRKTQGAVGEAVARFVTKKIRDLPIQASDVPALRQIMGRLYARQPDGAVTRELVDSSEAAKSWKSPTPLESVVDAASEGGLVEVNQMLVDGRPHLFLSLPQEALAQTAYQWEEDRQRKAYGRTRITDTLWIMIPLLFLVAAITWTATRHWGMRSPDESAFNPEIAKQLIEQLQKQVDKGRWQAYVGDLTRAEEAWDSGNAPRAREILKGQVPVKETADLRDFAWHYLSNKFRGQGIDDTGHKRPITSVAVSGDGVLGASASQDGTVKLWNLAKRELIATLPGHTGPVLAVAISPDGKTVASGGADKTIRLWDVPKPAGSGQEPAKDKETAAPKEQKTLTGHTGEVRALAFGAQGLVSAGADKLVITWDIASGKRAQIFAEHTTPVQALALAPDGKTIASAGTDPTVLIHAGGKTLQTIKTPAPSTALAFAPDNKVLATGGTETEELVERGRIRFWDAGTGKETGAPLEHASGIFALLYLPQGPPADDRASTDAAPAKTGTPTLASAGKDNLVRLWDPASGRQLLAYQGHLDWVVALAASKAGPILVSGSRDEMIKIWGSDVPSVVKVHQGPAQAVLFALNDKVVVTGGRDGTVRFWDSATGKEAAKPFTGLGGVTSLAFSAKEGVPARLAAGTWNEKNEGDVRLWELKWSAKDGLEAKELPALKGHSKGVTCLAFAPDGKTLASGSADETVILWDLAASKPKHTLKGHDGGVRCLSFTREPLEVLITGAGDGKVRTWNTMAGKEERPAFQAHAGGVNAVGFFFTLVGFVTAGDDYLTKFWVWNHDTPQPQVHTSHHSNIQPVTSLAFSPNRRFVATGSLDQTAKLFNTELEDNAATPAFARERFTFTRTGTPLRAVAVSADNQVLAAAGEDGSLRLWRAGTSKPAPP